jgi:hypothetical protein
MNEYRLGNKERDVKMHLKEEDCRNMKFITTGHSVRLL